MTGSRDAAGLRANSDGATANVAESSDEVSRRALLTPRELECLLLVAAGKNERQVSEHLLISEHTAEKHLINAKRKLRAVNRVHAVAEALRRGYIR